MDEGKRVFINEELSIPAAELRFRFATSSGPGGQHANRSATKVILLFDVARSTSLSETQRDQLLRKLASRLDKEGVLHLEVQESRSQRQNRETAVSRFQALLASALIRPKKRRKTQPGRAAVEKRLAEKKLRGKRKQERRQKWEKEE
ncbi:MAG: alternative ribosome rescue aminoacyl-tRNA hydrolase ArfB [Anaerolineae bacterium]